MKLTKAIIDPSLTPEQQQALALRKASTHPKPHVHFNSTGLLVDSALLFYVLKNIKTVLHHATKTTHKFGRPTGDLRSLAQTIILATLPSPSAPTKSSLVDKLLAY